MLNIYGQVRPHDEALILGDKESLIKLRDAIDNAIDAPALSKTTAKQDFYDSSGEEYTVKVVIDNTEDGDYEVPYQPFMRG